MLYEVTRDHFAYIMPICFFVFAVCIVLAGYFLPWPWMTKEQRRGKTAKIKFILAIALLGISFVTIMGVQFSPQQKVIALYRAGDYQTVEGAVENYNPKGFWDRGDESFSVDGILFSYCSDDMQPGYMRNHSHGGVITGNGQRLKIGYVYDDHYGNVIVSIEELTG